MQQNHNFFFHFGFGRKDYVDLIQVVYGIDCLQQWKSIQKRGVKGYDYLSAIKVLGDLEEYYLRLHAQPLEFED
ncbi:hypothetical protein [Staphylococcus sp. J]|uniref:hypothetical protein n=1 Tax=Staphylococcus sp. J TaxID=2502244 RepID=UPI0010F8281A|nr:hypothetical protein [Staphylococcus sp. J]